MKPRKRWKKILHNCPYLLALLITWLFVTIGGIGLMIYRNYGEVEWESVWSRPFFAVIMKEEMHRGATAALAVDSAMAESDGLGMPDDDMEMIAGPESQDGRKEQTGEQKTENMTSMSDKEDSGRKDPEPKASEKESENVDGKEDTEQGGIEENDTAGKTVFVTYTPVETDSIYYFDVGKIALTTEYHYEEVEEDYFDDAVFLGDSRTMGISDYAGLNADFYCENGMTIYKLLDEKGVVYQQSGEKVDLNQALQQKKYGKIYIMLGMNELGYRDTEYFQEQYQAVLDKIRQWQTDAVIYVMANLHVSLKKNNLKTEFNNININAKNVAIAELADGIDVFYLNVNPLFTDNDGFLKEDLTFDGVHLYANSYLEWKNFLMKYGVVKEDERGTDQN